MFNPTRLKVQLKLAINRLKMLQAKKTSLNQQARREIGTLLEKGKEESARIRVEHIIRDDLLIEALENLELYCDLLLARFGLLESYKTCEPSIAEAVNTIIWTAPRVGEVKELSLVRDQLASKFGKEFMLQAMENEDDRVNPRVVMKLQVNAPDTYLVERYLEEIARTYDIKWESDIISHEEEEEHFEDAGSDDDDNKSGGQAEVDNQKILLPPLQNPQPTTNNDLLNNTNGFDLPDIPINLPSLKANTKTNNTNLNTDNTIASNDDPNDFDALQRRLDALKRR